MADFQEENFLEVLSRLSVLEDIERIGILEDTGKKKDAHKEYERVAKTLTQLLEKINHPVEKDIVNQQLTYVQDRIAEIQQVLEEKEGKGVDPLVQASQLMGQAHETEERGDIPQALKLYMGAGQALISALSTTNDAELQKLISSMIEESLQRVEMLQHIREEELDTQIQIEEVVVKDGEMVWENLDTNVCVRILEFLPPMELSGLACACKRWRYTLRGPRFAQLWRTITIGDDPLTKEIGHGAGAEWLFTSGITQFAEKVTVSLGGLGAMNWISHKDCYRLAETPFPRLRSLVFATTYLETPNWMIAKFENLRELYLETAVDLTEVSQFMPHLRIFHCSSLNLQTFQPKMIHEKMEYLSFVYGVNAINVSLMFHCFPNLKFLGLEVEQPIIHLPQILAATELHTLNISWNRKTFWKSQHGAMISEEDGVNWFASLRVPRLILDLDYVLQDGRALVSILQERMESTKVEIMATPHGSNIRAFLEFSETLTPEY